MSKSNFAHLPVQLWAWDAVDLAAAIRVRIVSCREAVQACLDRMEAVNGRINAVVVDLGATALREANAADAAVVRGDALSALHGVPVTIKSNTDQAGEATSNGVVAFRDVIAREDSPVVANLRAAGAIVIGRTNTPAFSRSWFTQNDLHGRTLNPWSASHTPGGSSGGASASVAAGITPIGHGNDLAGSIRYPAYCTGLVGLRPSFGRVPAYLSTAKAERPMSSQLMSVQGPLARRVRDIRLALAAMAREDLRDPWWVPAPLVGPPPPRPIRVAISVDPAGSGVHPAVAEAVEKAGRILAEAGYEVEAANPPDFTAVGAEWANLVRQEEHFFSTPLLEQFADESMRQRHRVTMQAATLPDAQVYMQALARRAAWVRSWALFLKERPILLCPVSFEPPFAQAELMATPQRAAEMRAAQMPSMAVAVVGFPAVAVPTGLHEGVPIGVQLVAGRFREDLLLDAAETLEARCPVPTPVEPVF